MAVRTTVDLVAEVIEVLDSDDVLPFINTATVIIDDCDSRNSGDYTTAQLLQMETWLAAHFYAVFKEDHNIQAEKDGNASVTYRQQKMAEGLSSTRWGQQAMAIDPLGCLRKKSKGAIRGSVNWLGTTLT